MGGGYTGTEFKTDRHEKALDYALQIIRKSPLSDFVTDLFLYGSYARGDYRYFSDIDLFLVMDENARKFRSEIRALKSEVTDADDAENVDVDLKITFGSAWETSVQSYHENIRKEGRNIWQKEN